MKLKDILNKKGSKVWTVKANQTISDALKILVNQKIGALLVLALKVGNMSGFSVADTYKVYAEFDNVGGLKPRAPVKSAGVVVGRVEDIAFDTETYEATVALSLDKRYAFPKDTSAKILTSGLLGEQYIGLTAGGDTAKLKSGDKLKIKIGRAHV